MVSTFVEAWPSYSGCVVSKISRGVKWFFIRNKTKKQRPSLYSARACLGRTLWTLGPFLVSPELVRRQRKGLVANPALPDLKVGFSIIMDFTRQQELGGVITQWLVVWKFYNRQPHIEMLEDGLLPLSIIIVPKHTNRLASSPGP